MGIRLKSCPKRGDAVPVTPTLTWGPSPHPYATCGSAHGYAYFERGHAPARQWNRQDASSITSGAEARVEIEH